MRNPMKRKGDRTILIFSVTKKGHYDEYAEVFSRLVRGKIIRSRPAQLKHSLSKHPILFVDGDTTHLLFVPVIVFRSLMGFKNYMMSIRTEYIVEIPWQRRVKYPLYRLLRKFSNTRIISTHQDARRSEYEPFITDFIHDVQYWDVPFLDTRVSRVPEIAKSGSKRLLSVIGELNEKKSRADLLRFLKNNRGLAFTIVFAGIVPEKDLAFLRSHPDCLVLNRYITRPELFYIYEASTWIWAFYGKDVRRPSGIFGRAVQLRKKVIVRKNGFLSRTNRDNPYMIEIDSVEEIRNLKAAEELNTRWKGDKDSSRELRGILLR